MFDETKPIIITKDNCEVVNFKTPGIREFYLDFDSQHNTNLPLIDAINLESDYGIVFSSIISSGYNLAWFDTILEH